MTSNRKPQFIWWFLIVLLSCSLLTAEDLLSITVYQNDLALVEHQQTFNLGSGYNDVAYQGLTAYFIPGSLMVELPGIRFLGSRYQPPKTNQDVLSNNLGQPLTVTTARDRFSGYLQQVSRNTLLITERKDGQGSARVINRNTIEEIDFSASVATPGKNPILYLEFDANKGARGVEGKITYLTSGLSWQADYLAVIQKNGNIMSFSGMARIQNKTLMDLKNINLTLHSKNNEAVANNSNQPSFSSEMSRRKRTRRVAMPPQTDFQRLESGENYAYHLERPLNLMNNETASIPLFDQVKNAACSKTYLYEPSRAENDVLLLLEFTNDNKSQLGFPLPAGQITVFEETSGNRKTYLGGEEIGFTAKDEKITVSLGVVPDITATRRTISNTSAGPRSRSEAYQITLENHKNEEAVLQLKENLPPRSEILNSNVSFKKIDDVSAVTEVKLAPNSKTELKYTLQFKF